jgi:capsular polysaccharide biosynthesis protein
MSNPNPLQRHLSANRAAEKEINLKELFHIVRKRLWVLILLTSLFTAAGILYDMMPRTPLYEASTRIVIKAEAEMMNTLKVMIREPAVLDNVAESLNLSRSADQLRGQISVTAVDNSQVMIISVVDRDPVLAAKIANTTAVQYRQAADKVLNFTNISILSEAKAAEQPQPVNRAGSTTLILCAVAGIVAGIGLIFFLDTLDDSIRTERDVEQWLKLPVLGSVHKVSKRDSARMKSKPLSHSLRGETIGS